MFAKNKIHNNNKIGSKTEPYGTPYCKRDWGDKFQLQPLSIEADRPEPLKYPSQ